MNSEPHQELLVMILNGQCDGLLVKAGVGPPEAPGDEDGA